MQKGVIYVLLILIFSGITYALPVFPGAVGFGTETRAAYGGGQDPTICVVDTLTNSKSSPEYALEDESRNGVSVKTGAFRACIEDLGDNKVIVFEVSGVISIDNSRRSIKLEDNYVTIAGHTAPSPGITFIDSEHKVSGHDILIQHVRYRGGEQVTEYGETRGNIRIGPKFDSEPWVDTVNDVIREEYRPYNIVVDHISVSWAIDENIAIGTGADGVSDVTISHLFSAEGLKLPDDMFGKGMLVKRVKDLLITKSLYANNFDRNPMFGNHNISAIFLNNYIYNPGDFNTHINFGRHKYLSLVGNLVEGKTGIFKRKTHYYPHFYANSGTIFTPALFHIENNTCEDVDTGLYTQSGPDDWSHVYISTNSGVTFANNAAFTSPIPYPTGLKAMPSSETKIYVMENVGARPLDRDPVDERIIQDIYDKKGSVWISDEDQVGGLPYSVGVVLDRRRIDENVPEVGRIPSDPHGDDDNDGYTNLEEWLHRFLPLVQPMDDIPDPDSDPDSEPDPEPDPEPDDPNIYPLEHDYIAFRTQGTITVDGACDEFADADVIQVDWKDNSADIRFLWDDEGMYVCAVVEDSEVMALETERDDQIYYDDNMGLFFDYGYDRGDVVDETDFKFAINAINTKLDNRYGDGDTRKNWNSNYQTAVTVDGVANDGEPDRSYTMEMGWQWSNIGMIAPPQSSACGLEIWLYDLDEDGGESIIVFDPDVQALLRPSHWGTLRFSSMDAFLEADTSRNNRIEMGEVISWLDQWKTTEDIDVNDVMEVINLWLIFR